MPIDERWQGVEPSDWAEFARAWLEELHGAPAKPGTGVGLAVVMMNFTAKAEHQWRFICAAVDQARSDDDLAHIAAGPLEHLLGWHGEGFIDEIESAAKQNPKFARMLPLVSKYLMRDDIWCRLQRLNAPDPDTST